MSAEIKKFARFKKYFHERGLWCLGVGIYLVLVLIGSKIVCSRDATKGTPVLKERPTPKVGSTLKGGSMEWSEVNDNIVIKAKPDGNGIWTVAYEYVEGPAIIRIEANDGKWFYAPSKETTANGEINSMLSPKDTILPSAPVGAMIAKVGGSTAGTSDGKLFVVGKMSVLQLDQYTSGPLFLTINDELTGLKDNTGEITVKISLRKSGLLLPPQPPPPASGPNTQGAGAAGPGVPIPTKQ